MSARSGLAGKDLEGPIWGHPKPFSPWVEFVFFNAQKIHIFLGGPMGPIHLVWALAAIHPRWGNRYGGCFQRPPAAYESATYFPTSGG